MSEAFVCDAVRTPIGRYGGALSKVRADDLAALPIKELMKRNPNVDWTKVDDVYYGCVNQAGEDNRNVARWLFYWQEFHQKSQEQRSIDSAHQAWKL